MRVFVLSLCVCLLVLASQVFAVPISFEFSTASTRNVYLPSLEEERAGISLEIFSELPNARVTQKTGGLGVSSANDRDTTLDGSVSFDSLTFLFSEVVTLLEVQFSYFEAGDEFSLLADSVTTEATIPLVSGSVDLGLAADKFIFGVTDANDDYRIFSMTVDVPTSAPAPAPTPEPATFLLFGVGVAGFFWWRKRSAK